jgi:hypothetical protein
MPLDEQDEAAPYPPGGAVANFGLTIWTAELFCSGRVRDVLAARRVNDDYYFQGNYDYDAHAQVYWGGADPLGSQGYASVAKNPLSS